MITVKNLIEKLQNFNQDSIVTFEINTDCDECFLVYGGLDDLDIIYEFGETKIYFSKKDMITILKR